MANKKQRTWTGDAVIRSGDLDAENRQVMVAFSSEAPVRDDFFGSPRVLLHERDSGTFEN